MTCVKSQSYRAGIGAMLVATVLSLLLVACGGGGDSNNPSPPVAGAPTNLQAVAVGPGPVQGTNLLYTSVVLCSPGDTASCRTIEHVLVDTGSIGLRLLASTVPAGLKLAPRAIGNAALVECTQFADGFSWGPLKTADLRLGGETLPSIAVQIIGDPAFANVPADCSATGVSENTVESFGSNGVLGVGNFVNDCGALCERSSASNVYYACGAAGCSGVPLPAAQQVQNPVAQMATHNNGVVIRLPAIDANGAVGITGSLVFGIGTETNNSLGAARVYTVNPTSGTLPVTIGGVRYPGSFVDSGSNAIFFPSALPTCSTGFYCPASTQTFSALLEGTNGNNFAFNVTVANAEALFRDHPDFAALPQLAGPALGASAVDLGLPFFFGRSIYTAIEGRQTPGGVGPYVAF